MKTPNNGLFTSVSERYQAGWAKLVGGNTGLIGSVVGGYLLGGKLGGGLLGTILTSAIGAAIVLFVVSLFNRKKRNNMSHPFKNSR